MEKNGSGDVAADDAVFVEGGGSLRITLRDPDSLCAMQHLPKLKPGATYLLTFFVKTAGVAPSAKGGGACVNIWCDHNQWFPKSHYSGDVPWTKQGYVFTAGPESNTTAKSYLRVRLMNASGSVWFDDLRIREIPVEEPGEPAGNIFPADLIRRAVKIL